MCADFTDNSSCQTLKHLIDIEQSLIFESVFYYPSAVFMPFQLAKQYRFFILLYTKNPNVTMSETYNDNATKKASFALLNLLMNENKQV